MEGPGPLVEVTPVKQTEEGIFRRYFVDGDNVLTVWYTLDRQYLGFQLTLFKVSVTYDRGYLRVQNVDYCEKDNFAPILTHGVETNWDDLLDYFVNNQQNLEPDLINYILGTLKAHRPG